MTMVVVIYAGAPMAVTNDPLHAQVIAALLIYEHYMEEFQTASGKLKYLQAMQAKNYLAAINAFNDDSGADYLQLHDTIFDDDTIIPGEIVADIPNQIAAIQEAADAEAAEEQAADDLASELERQELARDGIGITVFDQPPPPSPFDGPEETLG